MVTALELTKGYNTSMSEERELINRVSETLEADEGRRTTAYEDTLGNLTIGVGHKITPHDEWMLEGELTDIEIDAIKESDIQNALDQARWMTKQHRNSFDFDELPSNQKEAVLNLIFNVGVGELSTWKKTLDLLAEGNYQEASKEILRGRTPDKPSKYSQDVPNRAKRVSQLMGS
jgi:lysozyme